MTEQRFSNVVGEEYDLFGQSLPHLVEIEEKTVETLFKNFPADKNIEVLEIGFGTGITSRELLKNEKVNLIGVDNEPLMLEKALEKLKDFSSNRFHLEIIDALDFLTKQVEGSFDAVISVWVLHNLQSEFRSKIVKEIYRVLKVGGIFVNGDKIAVNDEVEHKAHLDWQIKQFDVYDGIGRSDIKKEWIKHYLEDEDSTRILFENNFIRELSNIGFKNPNISNRYYLDAVCSAVK